jgi:hypothetical protein
MRSPSSPRFHRNSDGEDVASPIPTNTVIGKNSVFFGTFKLSFKFKIFGSFLFRFPSALPDGPPSPSLVSRVLFARFGLLRQLDKYEMDIQLRPLLGQVLEHEGSKNTLENE